MTLTSEMSRITRAMGESHTQRSREIDGIRHATSKLNDSIRYDLKVISRHVAATRSAAAGLIKRYKAARQVSAKALKARLGDYRAARQASTKVLKAKLGADRASLAAMVKKAMHGLELDRDGAGQVFRDYVASRQPKVKQSAVVSTRAPIVSPAAETWKAASVSASVVAAPVVGGAPEK